MRVLVLLALALLPSLSGCAGPRGDAVDEPLAEPPSGPEPPSAHAEPLGAVVGRVRDWDGRPIAGAVVRIPAHGLVNVSRPDGRYTFFAVPEGPAVVRADADGFVSNARTVRVSRDVVHEINLRLETPSSKPPVVSIEKLDGRLACPVVALGVSTLCERGAEHVLRSRSPAVEIVLEASWNPDAARVLNLTAGDPVAHDAVTGRARSARATFEGEPLLRGALAAPAGEAQLQITMRHAANATGAPRAVSYSVYATTFHDRPAPLGYSIFAPP